MKISNNLFTRFLFVGIVNTINGYAFYLIFLYIVGLFSLKFDYVIANVLSFIVATQIAFVLNKKFVFLIKSQEYDFLSNIKCFLSYFFSGIVLNNILLFLIIEMININKIIAPCFVLVVIVPLNFLLNKYWVYKKDL